MSKSTVSASNEPVPFIDRELKLQVSAVLLWLSQQVAETIKSGEASHVLEVRRMIVGIDKAIGETRKSFDDTLDLAKAGMSGEDYLSEVERIFAKKVGAGRKPSVKPALVDTL